MSLIRSRLAFLAILSLAIAVSPFIAAAHQPVIPASGNLRIGDALSADSAVPLKDPTRASIAVYGALTEPDQVDLYAFTAGKGGEIPIEVLVPVRPSLAEFRPWFALMGEGIAERSEQAPLSAPDSMGSVVVSARPHADREIFFEEHSIERLYRGNEVRFTLTEGEVYYLAVFDPDHRTGSYSLGVGTVEDFSDVNFFSLLRTVGRLKLGLHSGVSVPWLDLAGLFLLMAGFVVGLGAVTVIDLHGFLARGSAYWTVATTRTHRVTKPMIWAGMFLALAGGSILYRDIGLSGTASIHAFLAAILVANGLFLSFTVSPYLLRREREGKDADLLPATWQRRIAASLVISVVGWWGSLALFVWHLLMLR